VSRGEPGEAEDEWAMAMLNLEGAGGFHIAE